jgi:hypothetical protein
MPAAGQPYDQTILLAEKPEALMQSFVTAAKGTVDYSIETTGPNTLVLTRKYLPTWALVVAIVGALVLLLGLLALFVKNTEVFTVSLAQVDAGTRVTMAGVATPDMLARLNKVVGESESVAAQA